MTEPVKKAPPPALLAEAETQKKAQIDHLRAQLEAVRQRPVLAPYDGALTFTPEHPRFAKLVEGLSGVRGGEVMTPEGVRELTLRPYPGKADWAWRVEAWFVNGGGSEWYVGYESCIYPLFE